MYGDYITKNGQHLIGHIDERNSSNVEKILEGRVFQDEESYWLDMEMFPEKYADPDMKENLNW